MTMISVSPPLAKDIQAAANRIAPYVLQTPLLPLYAPQSDVSITLKLEVLQPVGSYKMRGAGNAILSTDQEILRNGIVTISSGNLGQGVAWFARELGCPCTVFVTDQAPKAKTQAIADLGATIKFVSHAEWWHMLQSGEVNTPGLFVHPTFDTEMMAGHGTIGLEIVQALSDVDVIIVPIGGGAMATGVAIAARQFRSDVEIYGCEVETAAPLAAAFAADAPVDVGYVSSFVDGIGSSSVFPQMWPILRKNLTGSIVVGLDEIEEAIRVLAHRNHIVAEGAGAAALAAALRFAGTGKKVAAVISGGSINASELARVLLRQPRN